MTDSTFENEIHQVLAKMQATQYEHALQISSLSDRYQHIIQLLQFLKQDIQKIRMTVQSARLSQEPVSHPQSSDEVSFTACDELDELLSELDNRVLTVEAIRKDL